MVRVEQHEIEREALAGLPRLRWVGPECEGRYLVVQRFVDEGDPLVYVRGASNCMLAARQQVACLMLCDFKSAMDIYSRVGLECEPARYEIWEVW